MSVLLVVAVAVMLAWCAHDDVRDYRRLKADAGPAARRAVYVRWSVKSGLLIGGSAVAALALSGRLGALLRPPAVFRPLMDRLVAAGDPPAPLSAAVAATAAVTFVLGLALSLLAARVLAARRTKPWIDAAVLLPRTGTERGLAVALSACAGVGEEALFRLVVPLLLCDCGLGPAAAFALAAAAFGLAHLYQGVAGVLLTAAFGAVLTLLYLSTRSLVLVMLVHTVIDLNALLVRPWLAERLSAVAARRAQGRFGRA